MKNIKYKNFIYTPVGFVCEHLEVLYDNDYECKVVCDDIGANYYRPKCRIHIHYLSVQLLMKSSLYFNDERSVKRCD